MLRKFAVVLTGLMLLATAIAAQDAAKDKTVKKKDKAKSVAKGTSYEVVSVDATGKTVKVKDADGKASTLTISDKTEILGPMGGESKGLSDGRLVPGASIKVVLDGKDVKQVYLPTRRAKDKGKKKTTKSKTPADDSKKVDAAPAKKADETKADDAKTEVKPKSKKAKKLKKKLEDEDEKDKEKIETKPKEKS